MHKPQYYADYLALSQLLSLQKPVSFEEGNQPAHDEMLFVVIHQAYELWFKQILFEVDSIIEILQQPAINDNSPQLQTVVHRLSRVNAIMRVLVHQMDVMETMTPMDFLDFRDLLRPASGFQSWQFKILEARLGLRFEQRFGQHYYTSALRPEYTQLVKDAEQQPSLLQVMDAWLGRMPFFTNQELWKQFKPLTRDELAAPFGVFWEAYRQALKNSLSEHEQDNLPAFDATMGFDGQQPAQPLSAAASRAALFIMLYRGYPLLQLPFQLINGVLEIDEQLSTWRYRHMNMVHRTIGHRIGTGGSSGKNYLKGAADQHYIFKDFARLTSFLIERRSLPALPAQVEALLGFAGAP
ncbi:MAG TPA: tryptophan 2,3-dioxygenase family protein [Phnomibacter sp.]|nr:tryptophan 2,3-dioxygenase family protein [Phnomibacter sp.]